MARFVRELEENRTLCQDGEKMEGRKIRRYTVDGVSPTTATVLVYALGAEIAFFLHL